jgi:hypothetical protein
MIEWLASMLGQAWIFGDPQYVIYAFGILIFRTVNSKTTAISGKRYAEVKFDVIPAPSSTFQAFGVVDDSGTAVFPGLQDAVGIANRTDLADSRLYIGTVETSAGGPAFATGGVANIAYDKATGKIWLGINGTYYRDNAGTLVGDGNPGTGANLLERKLVNSPVPFLVVFQPGIHNGSSSSQSNPP